MDKSVLKDMGLTKNETEVYLTLLRKGTVSVNEIAGKSGLHRQAVYDAMDRLMEKGFASFVVKNGKKYFQGIHPERIIGYLKEREERFRSVLPELLKMTKLPSEDTSVEVFKGKGTVKTVLRDIAREFEKNKGEVLISGVDERKFMEEDRIALNQYLKRIRKMKCRERVLVRSGDTHFVKGPQTEYRWILEESFNPTPIYVYGNKLTIIIWGNPNYAIMIENANLADAYRKQFRLLWKMSKKVK